MKGLSDWREEIDLVDRDIVALLNRRAECVLSLAPLKRLQGMPVRERDRETLVIGNIRALNGGPLQNEALERIYKVVIREMRAVQRQRGD